MGSTITGTVCLCPCSLRLIHALLLCEDGMCRIWLALRAVEISQDGIYEAADIHKVSAKHLWTKNVSMLYQLAKLSTVFIGAAKSIALTQ